MKKIYLTIVACTFTALLSAQEFAGSFLDKFGNDTDFEVVVIGKKMLNLIEGLTSNNPDLNEAIKELENIMIITSRDSTSSKGFYDSAYKLLANKKQGFEPLITVKDQEEDLIVMAKESKGVIKELVLLSNNESGFNIISLNGKINLKTLAKLSDKIPGLKLLESIDSNE